MKIFLQTFDKTEIDITDLIPGMPSMGDLIIIKGICYLVNSKNQFDIDNNKLTIGVMELVKIN